MESSNKKLVPVIAVVVFVIIVLGVVASKQGLFQKNGSLSGDTSAGQASKTYSSEVPKNIELTKPALENSIDPSSKSESKIRTFEINVSKTGYSPAEIVVNFGDQVGIAVTAVDGDYDFEIPDLGSYQIIKKGERKWATNFIALKSGTFAFRCRDYCPGGDKISGKLIVKE